MVLALFPAAALADEKGTFLSVQGTVKVNGSQKAVAGAAVNPGDEVTTGPDGQAVLQFFDDSQITLKSGSDLKVDQLQKPSAADKMLRFKLFLGQLLAKVQKLASAKSSFEIEAGGVVCGVRGTEFSMNYDSHQDHLELHVVSGKVAAKAGGMERVFNAGETGVFLHGQPRDQQPGETTGPREHRPVEFDASLRQDPVFMDFKTFYTRQLLINHDTTFTDPAVGGTALIPTRINVLPGEAVP